MGTISVSNIQLEFLEANLRQVCLKARVKYTEHQSAGLLRLIMPKFVVDMLLRYHRERYNVASPPFEEGVTEYCGIKMYYGVTDDVQIGSTRFFPFDKTVRPIVIKNYFSEFPEINYVW